MKIQKVRISNYRSIKDTIEIDFTDLTAMIGPNNSGKSNILWCINKLLGQETNQNEIFSEKDVYQQDPNRNIDVEIEFNRPFEHIPFESAEPAYVDKLRFIYKLHKEGPFKGTRQLEKYCLTKDNRMVQVLADDPGPGNAQLYKTLECPLHLIRKKMPVVYIRTDRITTQSRTNSRQILLNSLLEEINRDFLRPDNTILMLNSDGTEAEIPRKQWFDQCIEEAMITLRTDSFDNLKQTLRQSMIEYLGHEFEQDNSLWDIYFKPIDSIDFYNSLEMCLSEGDHIIPLRALGEGVQNAIVLSILNAYNRQNSQGLILIIEEPEMYLHPRMKRNLYKVLRTLSEKNQVIFVTHSSYMVSLSEFDSVRIVYNDGNGTQVKAPVCDNIPELKNYFSNLLSHDLNEIFFTRKVLLIENTYQKKTLLQYESRLKLDYDALDVAILNLESKNDILHLCKLALAFDMKIAVAFELNSSYYEVRRDEEEKLNTQLKALKDRGVTVFYSLNNYAEHLQSEWGKDTFQSYLDKFPGYDLYDKMMLFATDPDIPVPKLMESIISWITTP